MNHWVMDYETLANAFIACFKHYKEEKRVFFLIHKLRNDYNKLIDFLEENKKNKEWHISFNGIAFDAQITETLLRKKEIFSKMDGDELAKAIYNVAQETIWKSNNNEFQEFSSKDFSIRQVDVFKLNHWDNPAKRSSLKWIQYSMDWFNIQEMPIRHSMNIETPDQINTVLKYCINDVASTKKILHISKSQINLRDSLSKEYNMDLYSASEPRIAKELFLMFLSKKTGIKIWELRKMRTFRQVINVKDIILPYIAFSTPEMQYLLESYKQLVINPMQIKGSLNIPLSYKGVETTFALGGVHGANKSGVYEAKNGWTIMTSDVTSFYPNLAIRNKWSPKHIPLEPFCEQYEWFFDERKKLPKKDPKNYIYKIILNSTYGLSNDINSFLYDPEFTMRITINGQLSLAMLYEMLAEGIPEAIPLMQNTDGLEFLIPENKKDKYFEICSKWEKMTMLNLEHDEYQKLFLADVNNYIAVNKFKEVSEEVYNETLKDIPHALVKKENGKFFYAPTKSKGRFEFHDLALHKNKSQLIVPKAIFHYFIHNTPPEKFLSENKNIFDYCFGEKIKGNWDFIAIDSKDGKYSETRLQNVIRYYVSKKGVKLVKKNLEDGRQIQLVSGKWMQTEMNLFVKKEWSEYDVDESYYIKLIYKEIEKIASRSSVNTLF